MSAIIVWAVCLLSTCSGAIEDELCRGWPQDALWIDGRGSFTCETTWYGLRYAKPDPDERAKP